LSSSLFREDCRLRGNGPMTDQANIVDDSTDTDEYGPRGCEALADEKIALEKSRKPLRVQAPSPVEWFYITGGLFLVMCYFWLLDDAFVYFRYIDNLLFWGNGLVYNPGEYVEGFSSPLWAVLLILMRLTGMTYWAAVRLTAFVTFTVFSLMVVRVNRKLSPGTPVIDFPLAYLAFNYGVLCYFSSGMETPLVQVIAVAYALYILNPRSKALQFLLAVSPLVRHELVVPFVLCSLWGWVRRKKFPFGMVFVAAALMGYWTIFRIYYYADLFPNTFYLKNVTNIKQGLIYLHDTLRAYHCYLVGTVFLALMVLLRTKRVNLKVGERLMMILAAASVTLYVIKIGGDHGHYRYLAFPFCLAVCAFSGLMEHACNTFCADRYRRLMPLAGVVLALLVLSFLPRQLQGRHPLLFEEEYANKNGIGDASFHRQRGDLHYFSWGKKVNSKTFREHKNTQSLFAKRIAENPELFKAALANPKLRESRILCQGWCVKSYVSFDKRIISVFGLTDAILARTEMNSARPAHKYGLFTLAEDIRSILISSEKIGRGMYRKAVEEGRAPEWIENNLESIEIIERKIYNTHDFSENLKLALAFPSKIKPSPQGPNVVLIVVDTLRADHLGCYGYERNTSPNLDILAAESVLFKNAIAQAPWTTPSVASILTSQSPAVLGFEDEPIVIDDRFPTLAELLKRRSYQTKAIVSHTLLSHSLGFERGFDSYDQENAKGHGHVSSPSVTEKAISFLRMCKAPPRDRGSFFLFLHYFDPHYDYILHDGCEYHQDYDGPIHSGMSISELREMLPSISSEDLAFVQALYDCEIAFTDDCIGRLIDELKRWDVYDETLIIVTGAHGEEFSERGDHWIGHTRTLYQELLHVPLIMKLPGTPRADVVREHVGLIDLLPTIMNVIGLKSPEGCEFEGSLIDLVDHQALRDKAIISETRKDATLQSVILHGWKFIYDPETGSKELFNLDHDPVEQENVAEENEDVVLQMETVLRKWADDAQENRAHVKPGKAAFTEK